MTDRKLTSLEEKWAAEASGPASAAGADASAAAAPDAGGAEAAPELAELRDEVARLRDQLLRQQAEMANFRRRTERDRDEVREQARAGVLRELLSVIDDFERAAAFETDNLAAYRDGVQLILRSLADAMQRLGVQRVDPLGEPFDPTVHEAVEQNASDTVPPDHIATVYKPGYMLGERLLRPAVVGVASAPAGAGDDEA